MRHHRKRLTDSAVLKRSRGNQFRRKLGIRRRTFRHIRKLVKAHMQEQKRRHPLSCRGKKPRALTRTEKLLRTLVYLRHYPTVAELAAKFGISEGDANKIDRQDLEMLVQVFRRPEKHALLDGSFEAILGAVTEQPIERPTTRQKQYSSGKKKRHTINTQLIVCAKTLQILLVVGGKGRIHDFKPLKRCQLKILAKIRMYGDSGYQGLAKLHPQQQDPNEETQRRGTDEGTKTGESRVGLVSCAD